MVTYPGLPGPVVSDFLGREASRGPLRRGHDVPHRARADGREHRHVPRRAVPPLRARQATSASLPLERLADLEGVVVDASGARARRSTSELFAGRRALRQGRPRPHGLGRALAHAALRRGPPAPDARGRGVSRGRRTRRSSASTRSTSTTPATACGRRTRCCSRAGIPIVEHLCNLGELPESGFRLHCVPAPFLGLGSFPVRAYAVVD